MGSNKTPPQEAFVLAAGLGTRMRPITDKIPKPLVKVHGKAMLDYALDALDAAGVTKTVVNVHYLADQIEVHLQGRQGQQIIISDEREKLLDSGGGVAHGLHHFSQDEMFILNADSFWVEGATPNLSQMTAQWDAAKMDILLLVAPMTVAVGFDGAGDFFMDGEGRLQRRGDAKAAHFVYAGAILMRRDLFDTIDDEVFSLNRLFDTALKNDRLFGVRLDGLWLHVGTPQAIAEAEEAISRNAD